MLRLVAIHCCLLMLSVAAPVSGTEPDTPTERDTAGVAFFEQKIRPVLVKHCLACHSAEAVENNELGGGLQLDNRAGVLAGGESGPVVVIGKPEQSLLIRALQHTGLEMPPDEKLSADVVADFEEWVRRGLPDPRDGEPLPIQRGIDYEAGRQHWAYQPLRTGAVPDVRQATWPRGEIDRFILHKIEAANLTPAPDAAPTAILRRLCFDLTGLPPTPEQVRTFEHLTPESAPDAYAALVDELLASPHFGEQWARIWLDGLRYDPGLDTSAFFRNWVIDAFNADIPYHDFLRRQIAGDLLPAPDDKTRAGNLIATQMLAYNVREADFVEGSLEILGSQVLGISLHCAKCHDHKYDAVSQADYYALAGILTSTETPKSARDGSKLPDGRQVIALRDEEPKKIGPTYLLYGGENDRRGDLIPRRLPQVFFESEPPVQEDASTSGRLLLADWLGDSEHPLVARVMANRVWLHLLGRGIVPTPNDFGENGDPPTHPQLLDHLASRLIDSGGSVKSLVREIALSRTYQQAVTTTSEVLTTDHDNHLYTRANQRRLRFEQVLDQLYAVAGRLDLTPPAAIPTINKWPTRKRKDRSYGGHRTIYVRGEERESATFDGPSTDLIAAERARSVTAPQLMFFLNSDRVRDLAQATAARVTDSAGEPASRVDFAYRLLFARPPSEEERATGLDFLDQFGAERYVHALLLTNEFLYLD